MLNYWCKMVKVPCRSTAGSFLRNTCYQLRNLKKRIYRWCHVCGSNPFLGRTHLFWFYLHTHTHTKKSSTEGHIYFLNTSSTLSLTCKETISIESITSTFTGKRKRIYWLSPLQVVICSSNICGMSVSCTRPCSSCSGKSMNRSDEKHAALQELPF